MLRRMYRVMQYNLLDAASLPAPNSSADLRVLRAHDEPPVNRPESKSFLATALAWHGSVTPVVLPRVAVAAIYAVLVQYIVLYSGGPTLPMTPFEYSGAVLALILVLRVNAGHDRWWEARKIWGSIVNQSRNLAIVVFSYSKSRTQMTEALLRWVAAWPHVMKDSLRRDTSIADAAKIIGNHEAAAVRTADSMPMYVGYRIAEALHNQVQQGNLSEFAFHRAESERSQLIDAIGACERIRNTRMPLVLAIKTRRFILLFLALLPFALIDRAGWAAPLVVALASYPLFSLDEIGAELQNPFSPRNLSHLPLDEVANTISRNVLSLQSYQQTPESRHVSTLSDRSSSWRHT